MSGLACWNCGAALTTLVLPVSRRADCPSCHAELHCCRMCRHHDARRPDQCTEDRAEPPANKEFANVCDWFDPAAGLAGVERAEDRARSQLDALFGGSDAEQAAPADAPAAEDAPEDAAAAARKRLDDLFD